jgi:hypothetical protein
MKPILEEAKASWNSSNLNECAKSIIHSCVLEFKQKAVGTDLDEFE